MMWENLQREGEDFTCPLVGIHVSVYFRSF